MKTLKENIRFIQEHSEERLKKLQKERWEKLSNRPPLERLKKPCHDCAITTGFYTPMVDELLKEETELQDKALNTWYCHNYCDKACRGAYNYIHAKRRAQS